MLLDRTLPRPGGVTPLASCRFFSAFFVLLAGCGRSEKNAATGTAAPKPAVHAVLETDQGTIEIELLSSDAPKTSENFRLLAERGYFNGLTFHRIVKGFMIQGGDPQGDGRGGESAWGGKFDDEIKRESPLYERGSGYRRGIVAMANAGPNTNGSQFFILQQDHPMAPSYTIFGRVTKGIEVVDALAEVPTERGTDGGKSKPVAPPVMRRVTIRP
ncbi:MAG: peptidylprolyl isomerase [Opitutus sp.]|nr:peptidylprolyl isomerase [Opitutus sp.]